MTRLVKSPPPRLRQRQKRDGAWRLWWEPETPLRELGFVAVELDAGRLTWSVREAGRLNDLVDQARGKPGRRPAGRPGGKTVHDAIVAYRKAPHWDELRPATQRDYETCFRHLEAKWGSSLVVDFTTPIVTEWYEALYRTRGPSMALALIRKLSILMAYARRRGWRQDNPCRDLGLTVPKGRSRVATWDELDALLAAARELGLPSMELAIAIAVFQGQRRTDIVAAETAAFRAGAWIFRRSKRQNDGGMRLHPEVVPLLEAMLAVAGDRPRLLHYEGTPGDRAAAAAKGEVLASIPYTGDLFSSAWTRVRARAAETSPAIAGLQFRDLRRTFGHLARLGGADPRLVGDALGNQAGFDPQLGEIYMPPTFETASRAVEAIKRPKSLDRERKPDAEAS